MAAIQVLNSHHFSFAGEVINDLNNFYQIPVKLSHVEERFFNDDIRWALATISYLFRTKFFVVFKRLKGRLDSEATFIECCMNITAKRDNLYFFNFLKRVSKIYEMTVYCFKKGNDYFLAARNCIAEYQDIQYFHSVGSWPRLNKTAAYLSKIGDPLTLVILEECTFRRPLSFQKTVKRIVNRSKLKNNAALLNSEAMRFLVKQQEKFDERDIKTGSKGSKVKKEKAFIQRPESNLSMSSTASAGKVSFTDEKRALREYFLGFLPPEYFDELRRRRNEHTSGGTQYECSNVSKSPQPFELEKPCTDTESTVSRECDHLATESTSSLSKKLIETSHFRSDPIVQERLEEDEGKHGSFLNLSDKRNDDVNKTSNLKQLEEDLFLSESSSDDENSQQCKNSAAKDYHSLLDECGLNSSNESITSESPSSRKKINSPGNKTSNSELLEEDLFRPGPSSAVGNSQQDNITKATVMDYSSLLVECGLYSSDESIISESPSSRKKFNSPDDKTSNSELLADYLMASESSSEDENVQKPFMKESLERKKGLLAEYDSIRESNSSESQSPTKYANTSDNTDDRLNLIAEGFLNRAMQIRPDIFTPENVTVRQSTLKKDKRDDNNSPMVKNDMHSGRDKTFVQRTREKAEKAFRQSAEDLLRFKFQSALAMVAAKATIEARNENSQAASGKSTEPDGETETAMGNNESEDDQSTNVKDSKPQQRKKKSKGKKKKGKRK